MFIKGNKMASKTVGVSLNFDNTYRYEFTVKVPFEVPNDQACFRLTGANLIGQKFRLGRLGLATMELLGGLGHACAKENRTDEDGPYWLLRPAPESSRARSRALVRVDNGPAAASAEALTLPESKCGYRTAFF